MTNDTISADDFNALVATKKAPKYGNKPAVVDGITFDSAAEARRYGELLLLVAAGDITDLKLQPRFPLLVNGEKVCEYRADFQYLDADGQLVVEDVKGVRTEGYRLKAKLMRAVHRITVKEIEV